MSVRLRPPVIRRLARSESGTSLLELAILAPVLIFLLIGIIEIGRYMYFAVLAANAARAGVQYGAQNTTTALDKTGMQNYATLDGQSLSGLSASAQCYVSSNNVVTVCPTPPTTATPAPGATYYVEVDTTGQFNSLLKYPGIPQAVTVKGKAYMQVINQ